VTAPGDGLLIVGTTLACLVLHDEVVPAGEPAGLTLRAADDRGYLRAMPAMVGTAGLDWVLALVGATHGELDALLATSRPGAGGVGALPYLSPAGERAPFTDPHARGQLTGLSLATTPADLVRAYCEALGYAARHCFEAAGLTGSITICGGGSAGTSLVGLFADILDRPVAVAQEREVTARGAVLAALGDSPRGQPAAVTMVDPRRVNAAAYREGYHAYLDRGAPARLDAWWAPGDRHMTCTEKAKSATGAPAATPACGPR
jgi:xylulokinase/erythritol kinase